ncbi:MAG: hypothetical protein ACLFVT_09060 [Syntrophobacteria bacterium]
MSRKSCSKVRVLCKFLALVVFNAEIIASIVVMGIDIFKRLDITARSTAYAQFVDAGLKLTFQAL